MSRKTKCEYCDGTVTKVTGAMLFKSKALGSVSVPDIEQHKCSKCGNTVLSLDEADKIADFIQNKEQEVINSLPAGDFISLNQAAERLGITKQAFSKHPRIRRGFIYSITIDNKKYFYKPSVEAFKATKDGRVSLSWSSVVNQIDVSVKVDQPREMAFSQLQQQFLVNMASNIIYAQQNNMSPEIDPSVDDFFIPAALYDKKSVYYPYSAKC